MRKEAKAVAAAGLSRAPELIRTLAELREAEAACTRCPLYKFATQVVPGQGPAHSGLMLVGEQPGDKEDLAGKPFVGPAGQLLDQALADAMIPRSAVFVTNAVKHFKHERRGKRRLHKRPNANEIDACRWWMEHEIATLAPKLIVALGATAATSLARRSVTVTNLRGQVVDFDGHPGLVTVHPSYLLRIIDRDDAAREYDRFVADLDKIAGLVTEVRLAA
jgi:uracil-DNA glycosylase